MTIFWSGKSRIRHIERIRKSFENYFDGKAGVEVLGPVPAAVTKVNNKYRYRLSLSCKNTKEIRD